MVGGGVGVMEDQVGERIETGMHVTELVRQLRDTEECMKNYK